VNLLFFFSALLLGATLGCAQAVRLQVDLVGPEVLEQRLHSFPLNNDERQQASEKLFGDLPCPKLEMVPVGKKDVPASIICIFPGESQKMILVGAHFDKVKPGQGKIDNATGVVLLSALARALKGQPRRHTFAFQRSLKKRRA